MSVASIGLNPSWLFGPTSEFNGLLNEAGYTDLAAASALVKGVRQTAVWRYLTYALVDIFCQDCELAERRYIVGKKLEEFCEIPSGQGKRYLNSLGLYAITHREFGKGTTGVVRDQIYGSNNIASIKSTALSELAFRTSSPNNRFWMEPFQMVANTAHCLLICRVAETEKKQQLENLEWMQQKYPRVPFLAHQELGSPESWDPATTKARTTIYGVYLMHRGNYVYAGQDFKSDLPSTNLVRETIRTCQTQHPWVFPALDPATSIDQAIATYENDILEIVLELARDVGSAICGLPPFHRSLMEGV